MSCTKLTGRPLRDQKSERPSRLRSGKKPSAPWRGAATGRGSKQDWRSCACAWRMHQRKEGRQMASFWESIKVDGEDMKLYASAPGGTGPFPAIIVIQHQGGVDDFVQEMTQRIASA